MKIIDDEQDLENNTIPPNFQIVNISQVIINRMRKNFPELDIKINGIEYKE